MTRNLAFLAVSLSLMASPLAAAPLAPGGIADLPGAHVVPVQDAEACGRCRRFCYFNPRFLICVRRPPHFLLDCSRRDVGRINQCLSGCRARACRGF